MALLSITILTVAVIVLAVFLVIFIQKYFVSYLIPLNPYIQSVYPEPQLLGLDMEINSTWDGQPISHDNIKFSLRWNDRNNAINIKYKVSNADGVWSKFNGPILL